ncbi:hypothetical protein R1flu_011682 [Riccia fluitans]|uniref:Integrase catalytic domain-containing protein n=1 Tax=Riccia fluitans TaxID=41844 RepID=A0ABD1Z8P9_9MARC
MDAKRKFFSTEREALGMIFSVKKFHQYLLGYEIIFHVDHYSLKYLVKKADLSGRIARWILLLQEFNITVEWSQHANADFLSRLQQEYGEEHTNEYPRLFNREEKLVFLKKIGPFEIQGSTLYRLGIDKVYWRCLEQEEVPKVLKALHNEMDGGHFGIQTTTKKIFIAGYWCPTVFRDVATHVKACDPCQRTGRPTASTRWPLMPILPFAPFKKWGIDFVGPIAPATQRHRRYILVAIDYFTRMVEAEATRKDDAITVAAFLFEHIVCRYRVPLELVSDRGNHFVNDLIEEMIAQYGIKHRRTTPYNSMANGLIEKSNGLLCKVLKKEEERLGVPESVPEREVELLRLHEECERVLDRKEHFPGKLNLNWRGPYKVVEVFYNGSVQLANMNDEMLRMRVNGAPSQEVHHLT